MKEFLLSIIIPVYNAGKYFNKCISSIVNQTYKNLEIIIVDDGSTDDTPRSCDAWSEKDRRIKVIHKDNGGAASARNVGLDNAKGDYIGFVDADDYVDLDMYEVMLNEIIENKCDSASCGIVRECEDGRFDAWGNGKFYIASGNEVRILVAEAEGILPVSPCNKLFHKNLLEHVRFDTNFNFAEDTLFNFQVSKNISKMVIHNIDRYHYIDNSTSITHKEINENNFDEHRVMDIIFELADDEVLPHCIKGDVLKSFRTIRQMIEADKYMERFKAMRNRIISHKKEIFTNPIYSKKTRQRTLLLWLSPVGYKFAIKHFRKG